MPMRGSILQSDNDLYLLVRIEEAPVRNVNGTATNLKSGRYNLVNISTGKTRVSDPDRMFVYSGGLPDIPIAHLQDHFGIPLTDTGITCEDVNLNQVVTEAAAAKRFRERQNTQVTGQSSPHLSDYRPLEQVTVEKLLQLVLGIKP